MTLHDFLLFLQGTDHIAVAIRLIMATIFGGLVGWERIVTHHNAGIKTFALVSLGSAVATVLNIYLANLPELGADVSRIPAGVVSGIGFLGAGTILVTGRKQIKGLSTAATLWVTACMGMALGAGFLDAGILAFLLIVFANVILLQISDRVENNSKYISIYIEVPKNRGVNKLTNAINEQGFSIMSMEKSKEKPLQSSDAGLIIDIALDKKRSHKELISMFNNLDYVNYVEEV